MDGSDFYTFSESMKKNDRALTASMEDYLEMIFRLSADYGFTRINALSQALNVQPPSATKMVQHLAQLDLVKYEKYGFIMLEEKGRVLGEWLLKRHGIIEELMRLIGVGDDRVLEETEKAEHMYGSETLKCFECLMEFLKKNPDVMERYNAFRKSVG